MNIDSQLLALSIEHHNRSMNRAFMISIAGALPHDLTPIVSGILLADHRTPLERDISRSQFSIREF